MICAYCGRKARGTREHIISSGVLGLFPECFATIDPERDADMKMIRWLGMYCADCNNNRISYIDTYAKGFVETYFEESIIKTIRCPLTITIHFFKNVY